MTRTSAGLLLSTLASEARDLPPLCLNDFRAMYFGLVRSFDYSGFLICVLSRNLPLSKVIKPTDSVELIVDVVDIFV